MDKQANASGADKKIVRDVERFIDISGPGAGNHPKAHVLIRCFNQFSNGKKRDEQELCFDKPILNIFGHAGFTNIYMDFGSNGDIDLRVLWDLLSKYKNAANGVSYTDSELDNGYYYDNAGEKQLVHFPVLQLVLSPIGKETEYQIQGFNPAFFTLGPDNLRGEPCVLQFTFTEDTVVVVNDLDPVDMSKIYSEVDEELKRERESSISRPKRT